jgi:hypothetical protein
LQQENTFVCQQSVCDTAQRREKLTAELAADAEQGGEAYEAVAVYAKRVNLAFRYWESDCFPNGTYSSNAGMSCKAALDLELESTDELEKMLRDIAQSENA